MQLSMALLGDSPDSHLSASFECGVATPMRSRGHSPSGSAEIASASITSGIDLLTEMEITSLTASMLSPSLPMPGPITIASGDLVDSMNDDNDLTESGVRNSLSGRLSGIRLGGHFALLDACSGMATWTKSHPVLAAAIPDSRGAP